MQFPKDTTPKYLQSILSYKVNGTTSLNIEFFLEDEKLGYSSLSVNISEKKVSWSDFAPFSTLYPQAKLNEKGQVIGQHPPPFFPYKMFSGTGLATYCHLISVYELINKNHIPLDLLNKFNCPNVSRTANRIQHLTNLGIPNVTNPTLEEMFVKAKEYLERKGYDLSEFTFANP